MDTADEILSQIPLDQLAQQLGVDEATAEQAVRQAVPALLGGMEANARDPGGAASLEKALGQHAGSPLEGLDLGSIDTADGEAIVGNVFGDNSEQVINKLGELGPAARELMAEAASHPGSDRPQPAGGQIPRSGPGRRAGPRTDAFGGIDGWPGRPHRQCHGRRRIRRDR